MGTSLLDRLGIDTMNKGPDRSDLKDAKRKVPARRGAKKVSEAELPFVEQSPTNPYPEHPWHGWPPQIWNGKKWVYLK